MLIVDIYKYYEVRGICTGGSKVQGFLKLGLAPNLALEFNSITCQLPIERLFIT